MMVIGLIEGCFRAGLLRSRDVYRRATFNRWEVVHSWPPVLNADDQVLQELYAEATRSWAEGYGKLRLIK